MKIPSSPLRFSATLTSALLLGLLAAGCTKDERATASANAKEMVADSKAAMAKAWDNVKSYSFDKKDDVAATGKALAAQMEAQASKLRADYSDAKASASRKAAMEELKNSQADYKAKLDALGNASAATWDSAKNNTIAAWNRLEAAYYKARAE
jgi:hypothetical protein